MGKYILILIIFMSAYLFPQEKTLNTLPANDLQKIETLQLKYFKYNTQLTEYNVSPVARWLVHFFLPFYLHLPVDIFIFNPIDRKYILNEHNATRCLLFLYTYNNLYNFNSDLSGEFEKIGLLNNKLIKGFFIFKNYFLIDKLPQKRSKLDNLYYLYSFDTNTYNIDKIGLVKVQGNKAKILEERQKDFFTNIYNNNFYLYPADYRDVDDYWKVKQYAFNFGVIFTYYMPEKNVGVSFENVRNIAKEEFTTNGWKLVTNEYNIPLFIDSGIKFDNFGFSYNINLPLIKPFFIDFSLDHLYIYDDQNFFQINLKLMLTEDTYLSIGPSLFIFLDNTKYYFPRIGNNIYPSGSIAIEHLGIGPNIAFHLTLFSKWYVRLNTDFKFRYTTLFTKVDFTDIITKDAIEHSNPIQNIVSYLITFSMTISAGIAF